MNGEDRLEILSTELLRDEAELVDSFRECARELGIQLGWHYDLDLAWIGSQLGDPSGLKVLDAGAGTGVLQWWLADRGADVVSIDRLDRADLSGRFRLAYRVRGQRPGDLLPTWRLIPYRLSQTDQSLTTRIEASLRAIATTVLEPIRPKAPGRVMLHRRDLDDLSNLEDGAFDVVVSVSALEHNEIENIPKVGVELERVLKPGGLLLVTMSAARDEDWFHEPSEGWCLTEDSLRRIFSLSPESKSNFSEYDSLFEKIRDNETLQQRLAPMFHESGRSGMPWGKWDPQYQPVGVRKRKA
ncbi:MAG: class I SAM-dependent methyltransferase [Anaerolineales bacterium]